MGIMGEHAGWTAPPLSAMGSPHYSPRAWPDAEMDGHTLTKRRGGRGNGYISRGVKFVCVCVV